MKKSKSMRIASLLLVLVLVTTCFVGTTFAKYTSSVEATATATVAKWDVSVNDTSLTVEKPSVTFDLFTTILDSDNTNAEKDVKAGLIAPGTSGKFNLKVHNASEVTASYAITLKETNNKGIPILYSADGKTYYEANDTNLLNALKGNLAIGAGDALETVYWKWAYSENATQDASDTAIGAYGTATAPTVAVTATITVTQVD